jgi:ATP-dependent RNA helicase RhlE
VLVFARTKRGAERLSKKLSRAAVPVAAIHGNKSQNARTRILQQFRTGAVRVLVASDVAARGIDIDDISHVVNFDLPNDPETYIHRIGRTGRAGARGVAVSFCATGDDHSLVRNIERLMRKPIPVVRRQLHGVTLALRPANA